MQAHVEAYDFVLVADAQRHERADHFKNDEGQATRPHQRNDNAVELREHLLRIALKQARNSAGQFRTGRECTDRKHTCEQGAGKPPDTMHAEYVERVVIADSEFEPGASPETN